MEPAHEIVAPNNKRYVEKFLSEIDKEQGVVYFRGVDTRELSHEALVALHSYTFRLYANSEEQNQNLRTEAMFGHRHDPLTYVFLSISAAAAAGWVMTLALEWWGILR